MEREPRGNLSEHKENAIRAFSSMLDATEGMISEQQAQVLRHEERLQASEDANAELRTTLQSSSERINSLEEAIKVRDEKHSRLEERVQALVTTTTEDRLRSSEQITRLQEDVQLLSSRLTATAQAEGAHIGRSSGTGIVEQGPRNQDRTATAYSEEEIRRILRENEELKTENARLQAQQSTSQRVESQSTTAGEAFYTKVHCWESTILFKPLRTVQRSTINWARLPIGVHS